MRSLSVERLRDVLHYDAATGVFTWKAALSRGAPAGSVAGTLYKNGRRYITIARRRYFAAHLAWFYVYGFWPTTQIDHRNLRRDDDRLENLRLASSQGNAANRRVC